MNIKLKEDLLFYYGELLHDFESSWEHNKRIILRDKLEALDLLLGFIPINRSLILSPSQYRKIINNIKQ